MLCYAATFGPNMPPASPIEVLQSEYIRIFLGPGQRLTKLPADGVSLAT